MKRLIATAFIILAMVTTSFAFFGDVKFGVGEFGLTAFSTGQFGEGLDEGLFPESFGATFYKQYDLNQASLDADFAKGSKTATFTADRGATTPATTIETQEGNALLFDSVDDLVTVSGGIAAMDGSPFTVESRINPYSDGEISNGRIWDVSGTYLRVRTATDTETLRFTAVVDFGGGTDAVVVTTDNAAGTITIENDHNVRMTFNEDGDNKIKLYAEGILLTLTTDTAGVGTPSDYSSVDFIVGNQDDTTVTFDGQIKDVKVYSDATQTTLVSHYDFHEGTGGTLGDIVGSNDGTITGAKWLTDGSTYVTKVTADDTARFTTGYWADAGFVPAPGLLLEGASTNLLKEGIFSTDTAGLADDWNLLDDVTNVPTTTMVAEDFTNISGSRAQRWQQTFGDGTFTQYFADATAVGSVIQNETVTFSVFLKGTLTGITTLKLIISERDASDVSGSAHNSADIKASVSSTDWKRFEFTTTAVDVDASRVRAYIEVGQPGSGSIDLQIAVAQAEQAAFPSSPIPTTTAALTRNNEALSYAVANNFDSMTQGTIALVFRHIMLPTEQAVDNKTLWSIVIDGSNQFNIRYETNANNSYLAQIISGGAQDNITGTSGILGTTRYEKKSIIIGYSTTADANSKKKLAYIDGVLDKDSATYTAPVGTLPTDFTIQSESNQAMILTSMSLFDTRLDATQTAEVDAILNP